MVQSNFSILVDNLICFFYICELFTKGYLTLVLMQVVVCKDATRGNISKLLNRPVMIRWKLFKKSLRNLFYRISVALLIASLIALITMINHLWTNYPRHINWILFHNISSIAMIYLYHYLGHDAIFFVKLKLFLKDEL